MGFVLTPPFTRDMLRGLRAGERVLVSGTIYTARDAAHQRLIAMLQRGDAPPIPLSGAVVYYVGPCPAGPGRAIGSCGPTTSGRMDGWTPELLRRGLMGMIGKGPRSPAVVQAMKEVGAVYLAATGGAGALLSQSVAACRVVAFADLGTEAIHELTVQDFPAIVAIDAEGRDLYAAAGA